MKNKIYKGFYNIVKNESKKEATILIYGVIGGFDWDTYSYINTANNFIKDFKEVEETADIIHVKINSPGGNIHDGLPIYNALKNSEKTIYTYVDGIAYSMAALIALAGDTVYGYRNSMFMVHNGSTISWGNSQEIRQTADQLDKYDLALGTIIEDKLGIDKDEVASTYLNYKDNFFVGDEAKEVGFFDKIITSSKADVPEDLKDMSHSDILNHYSKMNFTEEEPNTNNNSNKNMSKKEFKAPSIQGVLGYEEPFQSNSEEGIFLQEAELDQVETALTSANSNLSDANTALDSANTTISDADAIIDAALENAEIEAPEKSTLKEKITLLNEQRNDFAKRTPNKPTDVASDGDEDPAGSGKGVVYAHNVEANNLLNN